MAFEGAAKSGFSLEDLSAMGPTELERKRKLAEALLAANSGIQDIRSPWQGAAQLANALVGNLKMARLDRAEREGKEGADALWSGGMGMGAFPSAPGGGGGSGSASASSGSGPADGPKGQEAYAPQPSGGGGDIEGYIRQAAAARGIDPDVAVRVASSEGGLKDPFRQGESMLSYGREESYGPFQLHMRNGGVGERALQAGIDPRKDWKAGVDFALDEAAQKGWGQWFGAKRVGVGNRAGLDQARPMGVQSAPTQVASLDQSVGMPEQAMMPPAAASPGQQAIGQALLGPTGYNPATNPANAQVDAMMANGGAGVSPPPEMAALGAGEPAGGVPAPGGTIPQPTAPSPQGAQPAGQQVAQALIGGQDPAMTLGAPPITPEGPDLRTLMNMGGNEFMNPQRQRLIEAMIGRRMDQDDPEHQLDMDYKRAQLQKLQSGDVSEFQQRAQAAQQFGLDPNSPEGRDFILTGKMGAETSKPSAVQEYEYAKGQGFPGSFQDWEASKKGGMSLQVDPTTGAVTFQQGGNIKPMTEAQSKDTYFATKAAGSLPNIDKYGDALANFGESTAANAPLIGNYMKSDEYQQAEQAGGEFLAAILRKESGAAVPESEREQYGKVYLPRPGDGAPVLAQKKEARQRALDALKAGMTPQAILAQEQALRKDGPTGVPSPAQSGAPASPQTEEEYNALPSGSLFVDPDDGQTYRKP